MNILRRAFAFLFVALTFVACGHNVPTPVPTPEVQSAPPVAAQVLVASTEPAQLPVRTYSDWQRVRDEAWAEYTRGKSLAWAGYQLAKSESWATYSTFEKQSRLEFRDADRETYLVWLDAKENDDYQKVDSLRNVSTAYARFKDATSKKFEEFQAQESVALTFYLNADQEGFATFQKKEQEAFKAYRSWESTGK